MTEAEIKRARRELMERYSGWPPKHLLQELEQRTQLDVPAPPQEATVQAEMAPAAIEVPPIEAPTTRRRKRTEGAGNG